MISISRQLASDKDFEGGSSSYISRWPFPQNGDPIDFASVDIIRVFILLFESALSTKTPLILRQLVSEEKL